MTRLLFFAALVYLLVCGLFVLAFALSIAVTEIRWRLKCRKDRRMGYVRDWTLP